MIAEAKAAGVAAIIGDLHDHAARDEICDRQFDCEQLHAGPRRMTGTLLLSSPLGVGKDSEEV